jgi:hypothetical protein
MSELSLLSGVNRTSQLRPPTSEFDPGCVKTRLGEGCAELFSQLPSSEEVAGTIDSHIDEIEMEILHASWTSEFSHSLDPERTFDIATRRISQ